MAGTFLSDNWYRVAALRPRLSGHARVSRQRFRGKAWYIVHDPATNRTHRFSPSAWWLASQLDGSCPVDLAWQRGVGVLGEDAPSQDEVIQLLSQLHGADLLSSEARPDTGELLERRARQMRPKWIAGLLNPMSVRIPLWDPDRFLERTIGWIRPLFGYTGLALWLLLVLPALFLAGEHWAELTGNLSDRLLSAHNLLSMALIFPLVKLLHELGHGYAVKANGGEVHEAGIMLLVFAPAPYVDASGSTAFRSKWYRAFVAAAGMLTELALAALALYAWLAVEPGLVRTIAFNVMMIAGISTLVFNANPLLRYDGYYILCDLIEIPNLGQRANRWYGWLVLRHAFRDKAATPPNAGRAERRWFVFYAPAAFVYRAIVSLSIALFIANQYFFVGVILALWSVAGLILWPAVKSVRLLLTSPLLARRRPQALAASAALLGAAWLFAALVPFPSSSLAQGVVWVPDGAEVRARGSGFVQRAPVRSMSAVGSGARLLELRDEALLARLTEQQARVAELEVQAVLDLAQDRARAFQSREALRREAATLADLEQRAAELTTLAQSAGTFIHAQGADLPGRFVKRGELLGYITGAQLRTVRVVIAQDEIGRVRGRLKSIDVMLADRIGEHCAARVVRAVPQGNEKLPSKALAIEGGGEFVLDPRDPAALQTLDKVFQLDLELAAAPAGLRIGTRAYVRLVFEPEPLLEQGAHKLRQLFLSRLHV
jgi:putative peptide zinc metalloprotease protein